MTDFPATLKSWRKTRRMSQLDLALEAEVSSRHISFLETGRAQPSRDMIRRLGDALQMPLTARNQMLTYAGFAARYPARRWDAQDMAPIVRAVDHTLERHAPFPGLAVDDLWTVVRMNDPARMLFAELGVGEGDSLLEVMVSEVMPPLIENWPEVAYHTALRLRTESAAQGGVRVLDEAADALGQAAGTQAQSAGPVVPTIYRMGGQRLALFSTIAQFGTPEDLTLNELRIELFFPADDETDQVLRALAGA